MKQLKFDKKELLQFLQYDFTILKDKAIHAKIIHDDKFSNRGEKIIRKVYQWKLENPILIFELAEQIEFNDIPESFILKGQDFQFYEIENFIKGLVDILGNDMDGLGYLRSNLSEKIEEYYERSWSFTENHELIKEEASFDPKGWGINFISYLNQTNFLIVNYKSLFEKN